AVLLVLYVPLQALLERRPGGHAMRAVPLGVQLGGHGRSLADQIRADRRRRHAPSPARTSTTAAAGWSPVRAPAGRTSTGPRLRLRTAPARPYAATAPQAQGSPPQQDTAATRAAVRHTRWPTNRRSGSDPGSIRTETTRWRCESPSRTSRAAARRCPHVR